MDGTARTQAVFQVCRAVRSSNGGFFGAGSDGFWWSSSPYGSLGWNRYLYDYYEDVYRTTAIHGTAFLFVAFGMLGVSVASEC